MSLDEYKHFALIGERVCLIAIFGIYVLRPAVKAVMRKIRKGSHAENDSRHD